MLNHICNRIILTSRCTTVQTNTAQKKQLVQSILSYHAEAKKAFLVQHTIKVQSGTLLYFHNTLCEGWCCPFFSVAVDASSISFRYYTSGIYYDTECSKTNLNHAMLVVGYCTDSSTGLDYWILKNRSPLSSTVYCMLRFSVCISTAGEAPGEIVVTWSWLVTRKTCVALLLLLHIQL